MNREQFDAAKTQCPEAILLFRVGDFYEFFFEDAVWANKALGLTLTTRCKSDNPPILMCGLPYHCIEPYIAKIVALGKRVAVCEQVTEAGEPPVKPVVSGEALRNK